MRRWLWHSTLALSMSTRPSAVRPRKKSITSRFLGVTNQDREPGLTGKGETDVIVEHDDLSYRSWVLQLEDRLLFHTQDHHVLPAHTHLN